LWWIPACSIKSALVADPVRFFYQALIKNLLENVETGAKLAEKAERLLSFWFQLAGVGQGLHITLTKHKLEGSVLSAK
jgi:hypothetical protein